MVNPNQLNQSAEQEPTEETVDRVVALLEHIDWEALIEGIPKDKESNDVEDIYPISNPVETNDDVAVVVYKGVEEPHKHIGGETEAHVIADGMATYFMDGHSRQMQPGDSVIISPETPHFAVPQTKEFVAIVVSSPNFTPENQVPLSPDDSLDIPTLDRYHEHVPAEPSA